MTDAEILASLDTVVWEPSCEAPDDPGSVVRHAAPMSPEERLARLQRDPTAIAARERRIAIEQGRVTPIRRWGTR